jgi:eukaryotic-like serine/threonine-protein kinase
MTAPLSRLATALADRYRIARELGAGGMATVYLARDLRHDRDVAIKVLHPELAAVLGAERFLAEIKTTAKLQHPHILPLLDSGEVGGLLFYVMPLVEGEALRARLERETQLPLDDALRIAKEVAGALDYAHRHGVIHRDIKPENILLHDGSAIVADFGIALAVSAAGGQRLTQTGLSLGTPQYMSPEQAMGERAVDARSDVYSLGCVLYEMLAGAPPFTGPSAQSIVAKILTAEPESVTAQRRTVPPHVDRAIQVALQKLPADRFGSAALFAEALDGRFDGVPDVAARARPGGLAARVREIGWQQVAAGLALLAAGAVIALVARRTTTAAPTAGAAVRFATPVLAAAGRSIAITPDGGMVLITCGTDERICARKLGQLDLMPIAGTEQGGNFYPSPNGEWVGFTSGGRLKKVRVDGGPVVDLAAASGVVGGVWGRDDAIIYSPVNVGGLWRIPASGGTPEMLTAPDTSRGEMGHWWPQTLPDGRTVLFTTYAAPFRNSRVEALDLRTKRRKVLVEGAVYGVFARSGYLLFTRGTSTVYAVALDASTLETHGEPAPVLDDVAFLLPSGLSYFALSDNGTLAYMPHSGWTPKSLLVWVDRAGKEESVRLDAGDLREPRLSPDQKRIAYTRTDDDRDVWLFDIERALATPVARNPGADFGALWTPDGRRLIYMSEQPGFDIYQRPADLSSPGVPLLKSRFDKIPTSVSPDGRLLAYHEVASGRKIKFLALDGSSTTITFPSTANDERQAAFSPDGRWLAYASDESGHTEVFVRPFPNMGSRRQQISTGGGGEPRWTRGGREITFRDGPRIMAASFDPTTGDPGRPVELFSGPFQPQSPVGSLSYDVTADGNRFLLARPQSPGKSRDVVIVVNWLSELTRTLAKK